MSNTSTHSDFVKNNKFIITQNILVLIAFNKPLKKRKTSDYDLFTCQNILIIK